MRAELRGKVIELRLDRGNPFELDVERLLDFAADDFKRRDTTGEAGIVGVRSIGGALVNQLC